MDKQTIQKKYNSEADRLALFSEKVWPHIPFECCNWLMNFGFFDAPASTKYHGNYAGGLFDHSLCVMEQLVLLTERNNLAWSRPESPYIVGFFHDLCKIDQYRHPVIGENVLNGDMILDTSSWEYNPDTQLSGHGEKSVMLLSTLTKLNYDEVMCIRYHMGAFIDKEMNQYSNAVACCPNVLWTHTADMIASKIFGK